MAFSFSQSSTILRRGSFWRAVLAPAPKEKTLPSDDAAARDNPEEMPVDDPLTGEPSEPNATPSAKRVKAPRLVSLDAFRGLTIIGMLLVNNISLGGQTPRQLMHAEWANRVHFADLVFPWFLFIVGVAVPYAAASARRRHLPTLQYDLKALWRALSLVFLGCVLDSFLNHKITIDLGVLQVIGLAYFVAVLLGGLLPLSGRLVMATLFLIGNYLLVMHYNVPGTGPGIVTEKANAISYLNGKYFPFYNVGIASFSFKGILSVIPTTAMVLIGSAVGDLLRRKKIEPYAKFGILEICGAGLVCAGLVVSHFIPFNKPLWTASYLLYCAGWGCIALGLMYLLVDMTPGKWGAKLSTPLLVFGTNAIVAYVAPILTKAAILRNLHFAGGPNGKMLDGEEVIQNWFYAHAGRIQGGWLYTVAYIGFWWIILLVLYRKRWFLRV